MFKFLCVFSGIPEVTYVTKTMLRSNYEIKRPALSSEDGVETGFREIDYTVANYIELGAGITQSV
jgi:hypothetical protein